ncbi:MAG: arylsulfatase [Parvibaculum sp.]|uniref:arylsulfatase n=1 Tax=Parvibaculum sp. TaxID=2024848 RepID=UPI002ABA5D1B|nr:arylsulfatase [Parvibaculum sp.]MDZ4379759.1 arylsulfatase [Parvibaculum sp.]
MKLAHVLALAAALLALPGLPAEAQDARPNIVLILIDDVGFSDLGAYGSEIATPNIDALAARGALFSNFHASPICAPSRAMLMTGVDSHLAGVGNLPESLPREHRGEPGYLGHLADDVVTVASRLQAAGYRTTMAGKWHLGHEEPHMLPPAHGFDRSFALDASGADNWEKRPYLPIYDDAPWFEDGAPADLPEDFYSSKFIVDKTIEYLDGNEADDRPFFSYLAFQANHIPVQAPRAFVDKYIGVYDKGWHALRQSRFEGVVERGLVPGNTALGPMPEGLKEWDALTAKEKEIRAMNMAVHAGMLEAMDHHVGRFVEHLKQTGDYGNTIFFVLSDNGPEPNDPLATPGFAQWLWWVGYSRDLDRLGEKGTFAFIGPEFANAGGAPGSFFKLYAGEGGARVPFIVAGEGVPAATRHGFSFITDIAPTILDLAGVTPAREFAGRQVKEMTGRSLLPMLRGDAASPYSDEDAVGMEAAGNVALFRDGYKLMRNLPPYGDTEWYLYNLTDDPGETKDMKEAEPERFAAMMREYEAYAASVGALEVPAGYEQMKQLTVNRLHGMRGQLVAAALVAAGILGGLVWLSLLGIRRLRRG